VDDVSVRESLERLVREASFYVETFAKAREFGPPELPGELSIRRSGTPIVSITAHVRGSPPERGGSGPPIELIRAGPDTSIGLTAADLKGLPETPRSGDATPRAESYLGGVDRGR
jgi:hypothetical protein